MLLLLRLCWGSCCCCVYAGAAAAAACFCPFGFVGVKHTRPKEQQASFWMNVEECDGLVFSIVGNGDRIHVFIMERGLYFINQERKNAAAAEFLVCCLWGSLAFFCFSLLPLRCLYSCSSSCSSSRCCLYASSSRFFPPVCSTTMRL